MKFTLLPLFLCVALAAGAQSSEKKTIQEKLRPLASWVGEWHGEATILGGPGKGSTSTVREKVEFKLDSTLILVEGTGMAREGAGWKKVHHALGIVSYEPASGQYRFSTFLADGKKSTAWITVTSAENFQWGFDVPGGKIRYNIAIDAPARKWYEYGEYSRDGATWSKFMEMTLTRL